MISDLKILNGNLDLKFEPYVYEYTLTVKDDVKYLIFDYILDDDCYVNYRNNYLNNFENIVYLDVYHLDEVTTYTFNVYKEDNYLSTSLENYMKSLEVVETQNVPIYKIQILTTSIVIIIIIIFSIIFRRKNI